jgi:hypothetical protein
MRVPATAMNDTNAREPGANRFQKELIEHEARFLKIQSMEVQMRLNGKSARSEII